MHKGRLEAFSDGVIAIIITIMVLEMKVPHGTDLHSLAEILPVFLSYVLSFVNVGLYWNHHHHLFQAVKHVNGAVLIMAGTAYYILVQVLLAAHGADSPLAKAIGSDFKGRISVVIYAVAIGLTFVNSWIGIALYVCVAVMWLIPDRRIEKTLAT